MTKSHLVLGIAVLLTLDGSALARHVTHTVTPQNLDEKFFSFAVEVKDVEGLKEVRVTVQKQAGHRAPSASASGRVGLRRPKATVPEIVRVEADGVQTYTFRLSAADLEGASFTFAETPQDVESPFPYPGDYWTFNLSEFASAPEMTRVLSRSATHCGSDGYRSTATEPLLAHTIGTISPSAGVSGSPWSTTALLSPPANLSSAGPLPTRRSNSTKPRGSNLIVTLGPRS